VARASSLNRNLKKNPGPPGPSVAIEQSIEQSIEKLEILEQSIEQSIDASIEQSIEQSITGAKQIEKLENK
jgi:hypothetical protein